jgi:uncharacterized protein DUF4154
MALLTLVRRAAVAVLCAAALAGGLRAERQAVETDVKAAFLFNFTKFAEWPAASAPPGEPFRICVVADQTFAQSLDAIIQGETAFGRPLVRTTPATPEAARTCQVLYVAADRPRAVRLVDAVRNAPVLTVSDTPKFLEGGGAIQFVVDRNRVRFDISPKNAERAGIRLSSKLLRVARTVVDGAGAR